MYSYVRRSQAMRRLSRIVMYAPISAAIAASAVTTVAPAVIHSAVVDGSMRYHPQDSAIVADARPALRCPLSLGCIVSSMGPVHPK